MGKKLDSIIEIANKADHSDKIEVWTKSFVASGTLIKDYDKITEGVLSLKDVSLDTFIEECTCGNASCNCGEGVQRDWLNIFEDKIIGFTLFKK